MLFHLLLQKMMTIPAAVVIDVMITANHQESCSYGMRRKDSKLRLSGHILKMLYVSQTLRRSQSHRITSWVCLSCFSVSGGDISPKQESSLFMLLLLLF